MGIEFLEKYCFDKDGDGRMFFRVTEDGKPIIKRLRYYYSETFCLIAMAAYSRASGDKSYAQKARKILDDIDRYQREGLLIPKFNAVNRPTIAFGPPMIMLATVQELRKADPENKDYYNKYIRLCSKNNHRENIDEVGFLCSYGCLYATSSYKGITNLEEADFEDIKIKIPSNYDEYLRKEYGNYWEFPPESERGHWHDNVIIFDPDISYLEYYRKHSDRFDQVLKEYEEK